MRSIFGFPSSPTERVENIAPAPLKKLSPSMKKAK
jgi:hypothetical protein